MVFIAWLMVFYSRPLATRKDRFGRIITLINYIKGQDARIDSASLEKSPDSAKSKAYSSNSYQEEDHQEAEINARIFSAFLSDDDIMNVEDNNSNWEVIID